MSNAILNHIKNIPNGYSEGSYNSRTYVITKVIFNNGKSFKIYGEELGGIDFVSLNYYITKDKNLLKPCEIPEQKGVDFLKNVVLN
ncbi:MAG: hypothetical protein ACI9SG_000821 [Maribacter sp.]|jgi:hypothetical protein